MDKSTTIQAIFLILLLAAIVSMIFAVVSVYKYREMLSNPVGYNMQKFDLKFCTCINNYGQTILISPNQNTTNKNI
jgi:hypothetical protein